MVCRLQHGVTIDYVVKFKPAEMKNVETYINLEGVNLVFETASNNQLEVKYEFHIPVKFSIAKPEPELITKTIKYTFRLYLISIPSLFIIGLVFQPRVDILD